MPVLIGWAAVTGTLAWPPVILFGVVFFWTPPHFWALAMRFRADYERAGVPMLPVVAAPERVARDILCYSGLTVATSLLLWPVATSWVYGVLAAAAGGVLLVAAHRLYADVRAGGGPSDAPVPSVQQLLGICLRRRRRRHVPALTRFACAGLPWSQRPGSGLASGRAPYDRGMPALTLATCAQLPTGDEDGLLLTEAISALGVDWQWADLERSLGRLEHRRAGRYPLDVGLPGGSRSILGLGRSARPGRESAGCVALEPRTRFIWPSWLMLAYPSFRPRG